MNMVPYFNLFGNTSASHVSGRSNMWYRIVNHEENSSWFTDAKSFDWSSEKLHLLFSANRNLNSASKQAGRWLFLQIFWKLQIKLMRSEKVFFFFFKKRNYIKKKLLTLQFLALSIIWEAASRNPFFVGVLDKWLVSCSGTRRQFWWWYWRFDSPWLHEDFWKK